jgi:DNA-binding response OmpR family regulator
MMGKRLLLADDSITIQKVVGIIFANEDYELTIVDNGSAALAKARETIPDIMLVDAIMPGMSGYEVCEEARREPALASVPILIMTGAFEPFDEDRARRSGASDFISKPFESQHLIAKVKELLLAPPPVAPVAAQPLPPPAAVATIPEPPVAVTPIVPQPTLPEDDLWGSFQEEPIAEAVAFADTEMADAFAVTQTAEVFADTETAEVFAEAEAVAENLSESGMTDVFTAEVFEEGEGEPLEAVPVVDAPPVLDEEMAREFRPSWEPVEEHTFAFAEPQSPVVVPKGEDFGFGAIQAETPDMSVFAEPAPPAPPAHSPPTVPPPVEEVFTPGAAAGTQAVTVTSAPLTEEQLRRAVEAVSKDVIERIVWEVVPDLAEAMIVEAIRRIREGR